MAQMVLVYTLSLAMALDLLDYTVVASFLCVVFCISVCCPFSGDDAGQTLEDGEARSAYSLQARIKNTNGLDQKRRRVGEDPTHAEPRTGFALPYCDTAGGASSV